MQRTEIEALTELREAQKPIILVFNQIDRYPEIDRDQIYAKIKDERVKHLIRPDDVVMTAARPDPFKVKIQLPDGTSQIQWERPAPLIEPLKARILDVLEREGKALVALNTLLIAGDLHAEIVERKVRIRDDAANRLIWNFAMATGAAVALNPIPVVDIAGGLAVDVGMIVALSKVYGIPLTRRTAASLVRDMMLALGAMGAAGVVGRLDLQRHQVVAGRRHRLERRPGRSPDRPRLRRLRAGPGLGRRLDVLRPRPRRQDLSPAGLPVGPAASRRSSSRSSPTPRPTRSSTGCKDDLKKTAEARRHLIQANPPNDAPSMQRPKYQRDGRADRPILPDRRRIARRSRVRDRHDCTGAQRPSHLFRVLHNRQSPGSHRPGATGRRRPTLLPAIPGRHPLPWPPREGW